MPQTADNANCQSLLLNSQQAAALLGISRKTLWANTWPRGSRIPVVTGFGRAMRYRRESLERWIRENERGDVGNVPCLTPDLPSS